MKSEIYKADISTSIINNRDVNYNQRNTFFVFLYEVSLCTLFLRKSKPFRKHDCPSGALVRTNQIRSLSVDHSVPARHQHVLRLLSFVSHIISCNDLIVVRCVIRHLLMPVRETYTKS